MLNSAGAPTPPGRWVERMFPCYTVYLFYSWFISCVDFLHVSRKYGLKLDVFTIVKHKIKIIFIMSQAVAGSESYSPPRNERRLTADYLHHKE